MSAIALLTDHHQYYLYEQAVDMRKSFDGLCGVVTAAMGYQLNEKNIYVFLNKRLTHIKLLLYEADGFTLLYHRLHRGRFTLPATQTVNGVIQLRAHELLSMLKRLHLHKIKK